METGESAITRWVKIGGFGQGLGGLGQISYPTMVICPNFIRFFGSGPAAYLCQTRCQSGSRRNCNRRAPPRRTRDRTHAENPAKSGSTHSHIRHADALAVRNVAGNRLIIPSTRGACDTSANDPLMTSGWLPEDLEQRVPLPDSEMAACWLASRLPGVLETQLATSMITAAAWPRLRCVVAGGI